MRANGDVALAVCEALSADWIRWHQEEDQKRPQNRYATSHDVHVSPGAQAARDVAETIINKWRDNRDVAGRGIPYTHTK